MFNTMKLIEF